MGCTFHSAAGKKRINLIGFCVLCGSVDDNQRFEAILKIMAVVSPKRWQPATGLRCHYTGTSTFI